MALQNQIIDIPLAVGMDTGTDPKLLQPGQGIQVTDAIQNRDGEYQRRNGFVDVGSLGKNASSIHNRNGELVVIDEDGELNIFSKLNDDWNAVTNNFSVGFDTKVMAGTRTLWPGATMAINGNVVCYLYYDSFTSEHYAIAAERDTGTILDKQILDYTGAIDDPVYTSNYVFASPSTDQFFIVWSVTLAGGDAVRFVKYDISANSFLGASTIATGLSTSACNFDAVLATHATTSEYVTIIAKINATTNLRLYSHRVVDNGGAASYTNTIVEATLPVTQLSIAKSFGSTYKPVWINSINDLRGASYSEDLATQFDIRTIATFPGDTLQGITSLDVFGAGAFCFTQRITGSDINTQKIKIYVYTGAAVSPFTSEIPNLRLYSKPILDGNYLNILFKHKYDSISNNVVLMTVKYDVPPMVVRTKAVFFSGRTAGYTGITYNGHTQGMLITNNRLSFMLERLVDNRFVDVVLTNIDLRSEYIELGTQALSTNINDTILFPQGNLKSFDGVEIYENNFLNIPLIISVSTTIGGATNYTSGDYGFSAVYTFYDDNGNIIRSTTAPIFTFNAPACDTFHVEVSTLRNQFAHSSALYPEVRQVKIQIYRTTNAGSVLYEAGTLTDNSDSVDSVSIDSGATYIDQNIIGFNRIYTAGGVLDAVIPPMTKLIYSDHEYAFLASAEDSSKLWVSKPLEPNTAPEFTDLLVWNLPNSDKGEITGFLNFAGRRLIFREQDIILINGYGPNALGQGTFTFQPLPGNIGCLSPRSIIEVPDGVMFFSERGFVRMDRAFNITETGHALHDENLVASDIYSATLIRKDNEVIFGTANSVYCYNYKFDSWSEWLNPGDKFLDGVVWSGDLVTVGSGIEVQRQNSGVYPLGLDMVIKTPWIKLGSLEGFQRIRRFILTGEQGTGSNQLVINVYLDYDETTIAQTFSVADTTVIEPTAGEPFVVRGHLQYQKCSAIMFSIEVASIVSTANRPISLTGLSLEIGTKRGMQKLGAANTI